MVIIETDQPPSLAGIGHPEWGSLFGKGSILAGDEEAGRVVMELSGTIIGWIGKLETVDMIEVGMPVVIEIAKTATPSPKPSRTPAASVASSKVPSPRFR